jgi:hypothetical protein
MLPGSWSSGPLPSSWPQRRNSHCRLPADSDSSVQIIETDVLAIEDLCEDTAKSMSRIGQMWETKRLRSWLCCCAAF